MSARDVNQSVKRARLLSPREKQVLQALAAGSERKEIAAQLGVTIGTLNGYCKTLYKAIGVNNCREAAVVGSKAFKNEP